MGATTTGLGGGGGGGPQGSQTGAITTGLGGGGGGGQDPVVAQEQPAATKTPNDNAIAKKVRISISFA